MESIEMSLRNLLSNGAQILLIVVSIFTLYLSKKKYFRNIMRGVANQILKTGSKLRYQVVKVAFFAFVPVVVIIFLTIVSILLENIGAQHYQIDAFVAILSGYIVLKSMIVFSGEEKEGPILWLAVCIIAIQQTSIGEKIKDHMSIIKINVVGLNLTFYSVLTTAVTILILIWFTGIVLAIGRKIIKVLNHDNEHEGTLQYKVFSYITFFVALIAVLSALGLKANQIVVFGSAVGVGIGLGLQKMASNLISGMVLLAEKNIRMGDILEMEDGQIGTVKSLGVRSIVVTTFDGKDLIIPNETIIGSTATNYTLIDKRIRLSANFYIIKKSDTRKAIELMRKACLMQKEISRKHPIVCCARDVRDQGVHLMTLFWISDYEQDDVLRIKSNVITSTLELMEDNKIELYFERSLGIFKKTLNSVTKENNNEQEPPFVNRFENAPMESAHEDTNFLGNKKNKFADRDY